MNMHRIGLDFTDYLNEKLKQFDVELLHLNAFRKRCMYSNGKYWL